MKVQVVRLITGGCITFLIVFFSIYAMGSISANRPNHIEQKTEALLQSAGEAQQESAVTPVAEPETSVSAASDTSSYSASDSASKKFHIDGSWFQGTKEERGRFAPLLRSQSAPTLSVKQWTNTTSLGPPDQEGKIVVISFWSTWCQPCLGSIEFNNKLYRHYKDKDVTFIGVCANEGSEDMSKIIESKGVKYPVCRDLSSDKSILAYEVQAIPSYFVVDRTGRLRFADVKRDRVDDAIEYLLSRD